MQGVLVTDNLLWSVMIPAYNPVESYFHECIESILKGTEGLSSIQIEVVDDASPDVDVRGLLSKADTSARIRIHQRKTNGGLAACWNDCIARARGEFVHILHQDDIIYPNFYRRLEACLTANPRAGMAFCQNAVLDERGVEYARSSLELDKEGIIDGWMDRISRAQRVQCPAVVVRRSTYDSVGGFRANLKYLVDWEMWVRIANNYTVAHVPEVLAGYRMHPRSETKRLEKDNEIAEDFRRCLTLMEATLPPDVASKARCYAADTLGAMASWAAQRGEHGLAARYLLRQIAFLHRNGSYPRIWQSQKWWLKLQGKRFLNWMFRDQRAATAPRSEAGA